MKFRLAFFVVVVLIFISGALGLPAFALGLSFTPVYTYNVGVQPEAIAMGEINGDGKVDLAVANSGDNTISVLLGNGNGIFQSPRSYPVGQRPFAVALSEFNGDGKRDIVTANNSSDSVSVLLGNGDGTFQAACNY